MQTSKSSADSSNWLPSLQAIDKRLAEESLSEFIQQGWHVIEPGTEYHHNWHIDLICEYLELLTLAAVGKIDLSLPEFENIRRCIFNIPPRYMKSTIIAIMWAPWVWIKYPHTRWMFVSYAAKLSTEHSVSRREVINSDWYQSNWGDRFSLTGDQNEKTKYKNNKTGQMYSTSVGGSMIGYGANFMVEDDMNNLKTLESKKEQEVAIRCHSKLIPTRLNDKKHAVRVLVAQRSSTNDVTGFQLAQGGWRHIKIPMEGKTVQQVFVFPLSKKEKVYEIGDLLWESRDGQKEISELRKTLGSYDAAALLDQEPTPLGGGIIKDHWWRFWYPPGPAPAPVLWKKEDGSIHESLQEELPGVFEKTCQSWDMAFKGTKTSAFVVGQVWSSVGAKKYLLDQLREKSTFTETIAMMFALTKRWPDVLAKLVEDKANGPAVLDALKDSVEGLIDWPVNGSKEARTHAKSPTIQAGNVFLPHPSICPWVRGFIYEWSTFPGKYKDQIDTATQAMDYLKVSFPAASGGSEHAGQHAGRKRFLERTTLNRYP